MERRNIVISKFEEYYDKQVYFLHKIMTKNKITITTTLLLMMMMMMIRDGTRIQT